MNSFTFDQLEAFITVVEQGSFSAAARALGKDRSTIHNLVSYLEIDWDIELFDRTKKLPVMRKDVEQLFIHAKSFIIQKQEVVHLVRSLKDNQCEREITIGYDPITPKQLLKGLANFLHKNNPMVAVNWLAQSKNAAIQTISRGEVNLSIQLVSGRSRPIKGLFGYYLGAIKFGVYCSPKSDYLKHRSCSLTLLQAHPQIILESYLEAGLGDMAIISPITQTISTVDFAIDILETSDNNSYIVLPLSSAEPYVNQGRIHKLDVNFVADSVSWSWTCLRRSADTETTLQKELQREMARWIEVID
ncbi:LysR family transcriptional regulator [Thaumasiovibrio sp. DFM-14]|uniref:LysR family transcriptional regulator n=1 Tax=Thaumasiovibrio sp. DFM-14 TaxID=3384792 RepID=UPI0039A1B4A0